LLERSSEEEEFLMHRFFGRLPVQVAAFATLAAASFAAVPLPVAAASACDAAQIQVEFLGVGASNTVLVLGGDGYYKGDVLVHVYCGIDNSDVTNAIVTMWTTVNGSAVFDSGSSSWNSATDKNNPVSISVPTGSQKITIRALDPGLTGWKASVGSDTVTVTQAFGQSVTGTGGFPNANAGIWAQTPELDSLSLFGAGTVGLIGYALLRRRARGSHKASA
jgi:hypothetical protein